MNLESKESMAYCGLNCAECQRRFADIRQKINDLNEAFEQVNVQEMVKMIPFMKGKYRGYKKFTTFFNEECPGCREKGGNPFCGIRKCATRKDYFTCAECESLCKKFDSLYKVHGDNEIQTSIEQIRSQGIDSFGDSN